jgi:hypothetical protein
VIYFRPVLALWNVPIDQKFKLIVSDDATRTVALNTDNQYIIDAAGKNIAN